MLNFNLIVGINGVGKIFVFDVLVVVVGLWFFGLWGCDIWYICLDEVRFGVYDFDGEIWFE